MTPCRPPPIRCPTTTRAPPPSRSASSGRTCASTRCSPSGSNRCCSARSTASLAMCRPAAFSSSCPTRCPSVPPSGSVSLSRTARRGGGHRRGQEPLLHQLQPGRHQPRRLRHGGAVHLFREREPPRAHRLLEPHARARTSRVRLVTPRPAVAPRSSGRSTVEPGSIGISTSRGPLIIGRMRAPTLTEIFVASGQQRAHGKLAVTINLAHRFSGQGERRALEQHGAGFCLERPAPTGDDVPANPSPLVPELELDVGLQSCRRRSRSRAADKPASPRVAPTGSRRPSGTGPAQRFHCRPWSR